MFRARKKTDICSKTGAVEYQKQQIIVENNALECRKQSKTTFAPKKLSAFDTKKIKKIAVKCWTKQEIVRIIIGVIRILFFLEKYNGQISFASQA